MRARSELVGRATALGKRLERTLPALMRDHGIPGAALAVCDRSEVLWAGTFGTKSKEQPTLVTTATRFSLQSISKMYTAVLVLIAVEHGLVELDEPILAYIPRFRVKSIFEAEPEARITLRHLLSHTAGFTHEAPEGSNFLVGHASFASHCESISRTWLRCPVGAQYRYSNLGLDLAGYILQSVCGRPFHKLAQRWLFDPLELSRTTFNIRVITQDVDRAVGHAQGIKRLPVRVPMVAAGGLYSSVLDVCGFIQLHLGRKSPLAPVPNLEEMYRPVPVATPTKPDYGLGVTLRNVDGLTVRGHSGGGFGFLADCHWLPETGVGVVVLTNSVDHPLQRTLAYDILFKLAGRTDVRSPLKLPPSPSPAEATVDPVPHSGVGQWAAFAGEYSIRASGVPLGTVTITATDGDLTLDWPGQGRFHLNEGSPGIFFSSDGEALDLTSHPPTYANVQLLRRRYRWTRPSRGRPLS